MLWHSEGTYYLHPQEDRLWFRGMLKVSVRKECIGYAGKFEGAWPSELLQCPPKTECHPEDGHGTSLWNARTNPDNIVWKWEKWPSPGRTENLQFSLLLVISCTLDLQLAVLLLYQLQWIGTWQKWWGSITMSPTVLLLMVSMLHATALNFYFIH